ncbi:TRAP-type C4-dicarboxylate transport system, substrate-binding protein [Celeribacter baekdonensis]|jgi:TRAP-type C4-dicarboxylate transport system substrate-binding protein|uniref:TRAP-type C4-dicarboxylate transport system, substrate-binding protein n=1 Tax=Celeribacter baekdonensis TaxID=875171 RepID=A0A1G7UL40_9RHOB|nr:TRAP transporter substrate-binding protein DctP [Celeribacter baekdonensis]SDG48068.1 TRAP-type C4-dicarboxylate transport system, substrate-binding protein [Celeribacter baekdonensis]
MLKLNALGAIALVVASATAAQAEEWTAYTYSSVSTTAAVKGMNRIAERVAEETAGDLTIQLHLGKTLQIASSDITQAVGDGVVDFAADFFFSGNVPLARVLNLPMLIENDEEWAKAYAAMEPALVEAFAAQDVVLLGHYRYPEQTIFTTFEIDSLDDLEGHKIRVTSPEQGRFIEEFGGAAITLAGSEVPTSLERGVIEGVLTASAGGAKNWHEFLPHNYRFAVNYGNSMIIANADAFDALSADTQAKLRAIVAEEGPATTAAFTEDEGVQMTSQAAAGMTIVNAAAGDAEAARVKLAPFWEAWAKENGPEYEAALQTVRNVIGK